MSHDLIFYETRSTPKVVQRGVKFGAPDTYGKVTSRRAATADEEKIIARGDWLRVDQNGVKGGAPGYKKTRMPGRAHLVQSSGAEAGVESPVEDFLAHYGKKGMKWGQVKADPLVGATPAAAPLSPAAKTAKVKASFARAQYTAEQSRQQNKPKARAAADKADAAAAVAATPATPSTGLTGKQKAIRIGGAAIAVGGIVGLAVLAKNGKIPLGAISKTANLARASSLVQKAAPKVIALRQKHGPLLAKGKQAVTIVQKSAAYKRRIDEMMAAAQEANVDQETLLRTAGIDSTVTSAERTRTNGR